MPNLTPQEALAKAIRVLKTQTAVAEAAGNEAKTGHVFYWLNKAAEVPAKFCPGIEAATRAAAAAEGDPTLIVYCEELCPGTDWAAVRANTGPQGDTSGEPAKVA
ncbi:MAG TPA: YdaS family helix-turn-helix protein [Roseateles sp.]|nr:YdaS family helix-turn-helix protein [Roseateles sp.]